MQAMVIVPTYNERDNIEALLSQLLACDRELQIIVVDDNSPDYTGDIVEAWSLREPRVHVIHRPGKLGLGTAYICGFDYARRHQADYILTMDADFSHHPRFIPSILREAQRSDVVIGSRYTHGGGTLNCTKRRMLLSRGANAIAKMLLGLKAQDCTAGFRCYQAKVLHTIQYETIRSNGYSYLIDMLFAVQSCDFTVNEVPILFEDRRFGTSKISSNEIRKAMLTVARLFTYRVAKKLGFPVVRAQFAVNADQMQDMTVQPEQIKLKP